MVSAVPEEVLLGEDTKASPTLLTCSSALTCVTGTAVTKITVPNKTEAAPKLNLRIENLCFLFSNFIRILLNFKMPLCVNKIPFYISNYIIIWLDFVEVESQRKTRHGVKRI